MFSRLYRSACHLTQHVSVFFPSIYLLFVNPIVYPFRVSLECLPLSRDYFRFTFTLGILRFGVNPQYEDMKLMRTLQMLCPLGA